jgi:hypothetical protein
METALSGDNCKLIKLPTGQWINPKMVSSLAVQKAFRVSDLVSGAAVLIVCGPVTFELPCSNDESANSEMDRWAKIIAG